MKLVGLIFGLIFTLVIAPLTFGASLVISVMLIVRYIEDKKSE